MARVIHFEIPSDNPAKAKEFYEKVFGWKINQWANEPYGIRKTGEKNNPGINGKIKKKNGPDIQLGNTISVNNLQDSIKVVKSNGGVTNRNSTVLTSSRMT